MESIFDRMADTAGQGLVPTRNIKTRSTIW